MDFFSHLHRIMGVVDAVEQHHKFVAAHACHRVGLTHAGAQAVRHRLQQLVARCMAVLVIHGFEFVQVHKNQGQLAVVTLGVCNRLMQTVCQQPAVGQVGEWVKKCQALDFILSRLAQRDVGVGGHVVGDHTGFVTNGGDRLPARKLLAIFSCIPNLTLPAVLLHQFTPHVTEKRGIVPP